MQQYIVTYDTSGRTGFGGMFFTLRVSCDNIIEANRLDYNNIIKCPKNKVFTKYCDYLEEFSKM